MTIQNPKMLGPLYFVKYVILILSLCVCAELHGLQGGC